MEKKKIFIETKLPDTDIDFIIKKLNDNEIKSVSDFANIIMHNQGLLNEKLNKILDNSI